jgi:hypothetical protein
MKIILVSLGVTLASTPMVWGQQRLRVSVQDATTGKPLLGATVRLLPGTTGATTDLGGNVALPLPAPSRYALTSSFIGYQSFLFPETRSPCACCPSRANCWRK